MLAAIAAPKHAGEPEHVAGQSASVANPPIDGSGYSYRAEDWRTIASRRHDQGLVD
jgi:hypothetical protein